jgi:hypothetical protein
MDAVKGYVVLFLCLLAFSVQAQKKKASNSVEPYYPSKVYSPKVSKKKKSFETTYDARDKYYDRMEDLSKKKRKNIMNEGNPQYTDFQYFGHKKPPKKRPPEKMKYCKICGIRH